MAYRVIEREPMSKLQMFLDTVGFVLCVVLVIALVTIADIRWN